MRAVIEETSRRIAPHVRRTECRPALALSDSVGGEVHLKLENLQNSGSFKLRGVINKILSLSEEDSQKLLVAASTGNHGAAFAHALQLFGLRGKLFMPKTSAVVKVENVRSTGVPFELIGEDCIEAERHAEAFARSGGHVWISPYNDLEVVHGQGTVGVELREQLEAIDAVLAPVGGGGLMGGVAAYLKAVDSAPSTLAIVVSSTRPPETIRAIRRPANRLLSLRTAAEGSAAAPSIVTPSFSWRNRIAAMISSSPRRMKSSTCRRHSSKVIAPSSMPPAVPSEIVGRLSMSRIRPALIDSYITQELTG